LNVIDNRLSQYLITALQNDLSKYLERGGSTEDEITTAMFLQRWSFIVDSIQQRTSINTPVLSIFNSQIYQPEDSKTLPREEHICEIKISIPRELSDSGNHTILDALESTIWWGSRPACLKSFSDILLIRLKRDDREDGAGVEILPRLPLSRFAFDFYQETEEKIRFRKGIKDTLENLRKREDMLTWVEKAGEKYHATQVLEATIQYVEGMEGKTMFEGD
jgi:hypothetical protein